MEKGQKTTGKGKGKWKTIVFILLGLFLLAGGFGIYKAMDTKPVTNPPVNGNEPIDQPKEEPANGAVNVLLLGSDIRKDGELGHTDAIILAHLDLRQKKYKLMSIPRDTRVYLDGVGNTKLTSAHYMVQSQKGVQGGITEIIKQVQGLTGLGVDYYAETTYWRFEEMIDALGGITMTLPFAVTFTHAWYPQNLNKTISRGTHFLDGEMVTEVVHERYSLPGNDFGRQRLHGEALIGLANALEDPKNVAKLPKLIDTFSRLFIATNVTKEDMLKIAAATKGFEPSQVQYFQLPGNGVNGIYDDALKENNWQYVVDKDKTKQIVEEHFMPEE